MKVFVAGARSINSLDQFSQDRIKSICDKGYSLFIGDCYGVDAAVQRYCAELHYPHVTVFASNGRARNNIGHWPLRNVSVQGPLKGFAFYRQKDIAMSEEADIGFMIWDGQSRGTFSNITTLVNQGKPVLVYLPFSSRALTLKSPEDVDRLLELCGDKPQGLAKKQAN